LKRLFSKKSSNNLVKRVSRPFLTLEYGFPKILIDFDQHSAASLKKSFSKFKNQVGRK
jgi:hypothetical protein